MLLPLPRWWTWSRSANWRRRWLLFAWGLVLFRGVFGPAATALAAVRVVGSFVQFSWNVKLGRQQPLPPGAPVDWLLVAATLGGALAFSLVSAAGTTVPPWAPTVAGLALLLPYSAIQLRMARRSFRAEILARMERTVASRPVLPVLLLRRTSATRSVAPHRRAA
ncbi:MAG: hypothetical protein RMK15_01050 [Chloroflexota bacterium]|nr:hypothetical protein [Dehalococcoidia bacterium]MDW8045857.1 hypothetical protein [Chloroflexota bacterium]